MRTNQAINLNITKSKQSYTPFDTANDSCDLN